MEIQRLILGMFNTNTYILSIGDECIVIDPASKPEKLFDYFDNKKLVAILLTHGHFDHIKAVDGLHARYNCPVFLNKQDEKLVHDSNQADVFYIQNSPTISCNINYIEEGNKEIGPFKFEVIYTPGHTKGSVCYKFDNELFTGDTLFRCSAGRTDLDTGSETELKTSLRLIRSYNENLNIYPGHDDISTLDFEKENNPFLQ